MTKTEQNAPAVYAGIAAITAELAKMGISKDRKNAQQGYAFRGIDDVYNVLAPILAAHNIVIVPNIVNHSQTERVTARGGNLIFSKVTMKYTVVSAVDGSSTEASTVGEAMDAADKSSNKAMSAAYKYMAYQLFCIPTEGEDNDADATTPEPSKAKEVLDHNSPRWANCIKALETAQVTAGTVFNMFAVPEEDRHYIIDAEKRAQQPSAAPSTTTTTKQ